MMQRELFLQADAALRSVIDRLTPEGCTAEAPGEWSGDLDFLRLTLAGQAEINGRVVQHDGKRAEIRFFGQIHPLVIENWRQRAA